MREVGLAATLWKRSQIVHCDARHYRFGLRGLVLEQSVKPRTIEPLPIG
jgi:hypothetical protein